jgi:hypothetical protein
MQLISSMTWDEWVNGTDENCIIKFIFSPSALGAVPPLSQSWTF